jgi:hypothetical protein
MRASCVQPWVLVNLKQPNPKVLIDEKIISQHLKAIRDMVLVHFLLDGENGIDYNVLCFLYNIPSKVYIQIREFLIQIALKHFKAKSISYFMLPILISLLLQT